MLEYPLDISLAPKMDFLSNSHTSRRATALNVPQQFKPAAIIAGVAIAVWGVSLSPVHAQTKVEQKSQELAKKLFSSIERIQSASSLVDANISFCFEHAEDTVPAMQAASNVWRDANNIPYLLKAIKEMSPKANELAQQSFGKHREALATKPSPERQANCNKFTAQLTAGSLDLSNNLAKEVDFVMAFAKRTGIKKLRKRNIPSVQNPRYTDLKAKGIDPHDTFIPTAFKCYSNIYTDTPLEAEFDVQIKEGGRYKSSYGSGTYMPVWSGPLATHTELDIKFDQYGQSLLFKSLTLDANKADYTCFQQGASNTAARINHDLTLPKVASYECLSSSGESMPAFEITSGTTYQVNGAEGEYSLDKIENYYSKRGIGFTSGPLKSATASYSQSAETGEKSLRFTEVSKFVSSIVPVAASSSSLTMTCSSAGEPTPYPQFGDEAAPKPPSGAGGLEGVYYKRKSSSSDKRSRYDFYYFAPSGYMRAGDFSNPPQEYDCTRTYPNGSERCKTYKVKGSNITLNPGAEYEQNLDLDSLEKLDGKKHELVGTYWANESSQTGMCGFDGFSCAISYYETSMSFYEDGTFYAGESSQHTASAGFGGVSASSLGTGTASDKGTYTIENNVLELRYPSGKVSRQFIGVISERTVELGGWTLGLKSTD